MATCLRCHRPLSNPDSVVNGMGPICAGKASRRQSSGPFTQSDYRVINFNDEMVWIVDLDLGGRSVTNDADRVCREVHNLFPGRRIIYRDSIGRWDELRHDRGRFIDFAPAAHLDPAKLSDLFA